MFSIWKSDFENEKTYTRASIFDTNALIGIKFSEGKTLAGKMPQIKIEVISKCIPSDYFSVGPLFVISDRIRELFEKEKASVDYFPVYLFRNKIELDAIKYYFVNFFKKIDCFDYEKSRYSMDGTYIDKIEKLAIIENKADGETIFRLDRSFDLITIVNKNLCDLIMNSDISGVKFIKPSEWNW